MKEKLQAKGPKGRSQRNFSKGKNMVDLGFIKQNEEKDEPIILKSKKNLLDKKPNNETRKIHESKTWKEKNISDKKNNIKKITYENDDEPNDKIAQKPNDYTPNQNNKFIIKILLKNLITKKISIYRENLQKYFLRYYYNVLYYKKINENIKNNVEKENINENLEEKNDTKKTLEQNNETKKEKDIRINNEKDKEVKITFEKENIEPKKENNKEIVEKENEVIREKNDNIKEKDQKEIENMENKNKDKEIIEKEKEKKIIV